MRKLRIQEMKEDELAMVMSWAEDEGWNPGKYDYQSYYALDKRNLLLMFLNEEPIGSISIVKYSSQFAFIGLFIVKKKYRNQGYGTKLWEAAMELLEQYSSVALYAVPKQVRRYQKSGFSAQYFNSRWNLNASKAEDVSTFITNQQDPQVIYNKMLEYDCKLWGGQRSLFLDKVLTQEQSYAFVTFNQTTGKVNGYGVIRPCIKGYRIGPLYAHDLEDAKILARVLMAQVPNESKVIFDIPEKNRFSHVFAEYFGLERAPGIDTFVMIKGEDYDRNEEICYGKASLEIG